MLCCIGLLLGSVIGSTLGIPYITIPLGGAIGLFADIKILRAFNRSRTCKLSLCSISDLFDRERTIIKEEKK